MSADRDTPEAPTTFDEVRLDALDCVEGIGFLVKQCQGAAGAIDGISTWNNPDDVEKRQALEFVAAGLQQLLFKASQQIEECYGLIRQLREADEAEPDEPLDVPQVPPEQQVKLCGTTDIPMPLWRDGKRKGRA